MSILSGREILRQMEKGSIKIDPFNVEQINPNSYNVRLHNELKVYEEIPLDMKKVNPTKTITIPEEGLLIYPGQFFLGRTVEKTFTEGFVPMLDGRSSIARLGIFVHVTAGFGDNGFNGYWTLEITPILPIRIYAGIEIGQVFYHPVLGEETYYHNGKYQDNDDIQASKLYEDFQKGV